MTSKSKMDRSAGLRLTIEEMAARIPGPDGERYHVGLERGELTVEIYEPVGTDTQQPHSRDECYIITRGEGVFQMGAEKVPFKPGDFLFVPAGIEHRFLDFDKSMQAWVIFYGPEGGDTP